MNVSHSQSNPAIRDALLRVYEQGRADRTKPFEPDRFLAFLSDPPARGRGVKDTFAGRFRYVRFFQAVQLEFGICFSRGDWDAPFTLDQFVKRIATKMKNPAATRRLAVKRLAEARSARFSDPIKMSVITVPILIAALTIENLFLRIPLASLCLAITIGITYVSVQEYQFAKKLLKRIDGSLG